MWEQCVVLEDVPDGSTLGRHPYARARVVEHVAVDGDTPLVEGEQSCDHSQHGRLPGPVGSEQHDRLTEPGLERDVERERSEADADARVETHAGNQRSRSDTSTTTDTASSTRLSAIAPPRLVWSSTKIASGMVCVSPWRFPANRIVAPNSPSARAHGSTTRRKVVKPRAPSVAAASS